MSWSEHRVQDHRKQTDRAIHRAFLQLASDPRTSATFQHLLTYVRRLAPRLFEAPVANGRHLGVDALVHLARFRSAHIRSMADWAGSAPSWRPAISSLAHHLVCTYRVPEFMTSVWYAGDAAGDKKRSWVVAHSRGASVRSLDLPITMTRKMERIFLESRDHLPLETALRRAELLSVGVPSDFVKAILSTRLATDLRNGDFWRTFWMFLSAHADEISPTQIGPMIDYIQAIRHDLIRIETQDGVTEISPPQPDFSIKGRTVPSILRLMREWHRTLGRSSSDATFSWAQSRFKPWLVQEPIRDGAETPTRWHMVELTDSAQLRQEGLAMHHCVGSYAHLCYRGSSSIWSLRIWRGNNIRSVLTVEIDSKKRAVIQARGKANRSPSGKPLQFLRDWAVREGLQMTI